MEKIYRGTLADTLEYIVINVDQFCVNGNIDNARKLDAIKCEMLSLNIDYDTEIILYKSDIVGYHYEIVEEKELTIEDIIDNTKEEFETILGFGAMYGSYTQETRLLTDVELEILKNYMSVFTSKLKQNIKKLESDEE